VLGGGGELGYIYLKTFSSFLQIQRLAQHVVSLLQQ
jgi:hypothetical protein